MNINHSIAILIVSVCISSALYAVTSAYTIHTHAEEVGQESVGEVLPPPLIPIEEPEVTPCYTEEDVVLLAKTLYGECRGVKSVTQQACVAWTVLNRADAQSITVAEVVKQPFQFAYREWSPVTDELYALAKDVLDRWSAEKVGITDVGRVLPKEYTYFASYKGVNYFRDAYRNGNIWDYTLESPYET